MFTLPSQFNFTSFSDTQFCSTNEEPATSEDVPPTEEVEAKLPDDEHKDGEKAHKEGSKATFAMSKQMTALLRRDVEDDFRDEDPEKIIKVVVLGDGTSRCLYGRIHNCRF